MFLNKPCPNRFSTNQTRAGFPIIWNITISSSSAAVPLAAGPRYRLRNSAGKSWWWKGGRRVGGVSVHTGTIPSKTLRETALNLSGWRERGFYGRSYRVKQDLTASDLRARLAITLNHEIEVLEHQFARNRVTTLRGDASFKDRSTIEVRGEEGETFEFTSDAFLLAVGTIPFRPDYVPFDGTSVFDSDEILNLTHLPRSMTVIGAGVIGIEYATIFSSLDVHVTLVEPRETMLDFIDRGTDRRLRPPAQGPRHGAALRQEGRKHQQA